MYRDVDCPFCGASQAWPCETVSGAESGPHSARIKLSLAKENEMPCDCSHMEPSAREIESKIVTDHLQWVFVKLNIDIPKDVNTAAGEYYGNVSLLDQHTALLCGLMKEHGDKFQTRLVKGFTGDLRLWLWWTNHQEHDDAKKQAELDKANAERNRDLIELDRLLAKYPGYGR